LEQFKKEERVEMKISMKAGTIMEIKVQTRRLRKRRRRLKLVQKLKN